MSPEGKIGGGDAPDAMPEETEPQIHPEAEQIFLSEGIARYPLKIGTEHTCYPELNTMQSFLVTHGPPTP